MRTAPLILFVLLAGSTTGFCASKDSPPPDKDMLRMMDFLREMEMIKQAEMMQDLSQLEPVGDSITNDRVQKSLPSKKNEAAK